VSVAKSAIRYNMKDQLPAIKVPTLLIWGTHDNVTPPFVADEFKKLLPNAQLIWMDKTGHAPMMERPDEFNIHLAKFLSEQG
jgi:2-hydroxy-6-oxonona-2,4-dienedioate hydrolase